MKIQVRRLHVASRFMRSSVTRGLPCSIQESSLATEEAILFGIDDARPIVMAVFAESVGIPTDETTGWLPYPIPKEYFCTLACISHAPSKKRCRPR